MRGSPETELCGWTSAFRPLSIDDGRVWSAWGLVNAPRHPGDQAQQCVRITGDRGVYFGVEYPEAQTLPAQSMASLEGYSREELLAHLHAVAKAQFAREPAGHTLQPTAVVHEAWLRIAAQTDGSLESEAVFRQWAGKIVRQVLIDYARIRNAQCRDARKRVALGEHESHQGMSAEELVQLSDLLDKLAAVQPRMAAVVEMRFFGGMRDADIAARLGVSTRIIRSDWVAARAWLYGKMTAR